MKRAAAIVKKFLLMIYFLLHNASGYTVMAVKRRFIVLTCVKIRIKSFI